MTRQRLRESSVRWNMTLSLDSFALKIIKKGEELAFSNKAKIININVPPKVKNYIEENLIKEINHFKTKYKLEFNIISDSMLVIPEYKINLLNKNKKTIKKIENIETIKKERIQSNYIGKKFNNKKFVGRHKYKKKNNFTSNKKKDYFHSKKTTDTSFPKKLN
jgi:ribonuclease E